MTASIEELFTQAKQVMDVARKMMLKRIAVDEHAAKGDKDFATAVDFAIEAKVRSLLRKATPEIPIMGEEEGGADIGETLFWVLDPIDGTINYSRNLPLCGISLALVKGGQAVIGLVELPYLRQSYTAIEGAGAFLNGEMIVVSKTASLDQAIVSFGDFAVGESSSLKNERRLNVMKSLSAKALRVRMLGSAAIDLSWLANGLVDASITLSNNAWDVQAGCLIVREAGGMVCDLDGSPHTVLSGCTIATTPSLKSELLELLAASFH